MDLSNDNIEGEKEEGVSGRGGASLWGDREEEERLRTGSITWVPFGTLWSELLRF